MNEYTDSLQPPLKKAKLDEADMFMTIDKYIDLIASTDKPLKVVLDEVVSAPLPITKVCIGHIKDVKAISKTVLLLNEKMPLRELQHLKRVRKQEIVLCPSSYLKDTSIKQYLAGCDEKLTEIFDSFKEADVPMLPPKLKSQFDDTRKYWPCNFHPDKYLEKLFSDNVFSADENKLHRLYMRMVFVVTKWFCERTGISIGHVNSNRVSKDLNVTVIVDPSINSVVAISTDNRLKHPIQHSVMLAIDNVARTQKGGAWDIDHKLDDDAFIDLELLNFLKMEFRNVKFGHRKFVSKRDSSNNGIEVLDQDGPYLCTGYYVYMLREPCVMCSMGLVHARARRIFFCFDNEEDGALKSKAKLQTVASLNHHFEVFTGFL
ncbi:probable inactive tRNA-specific adenosine deaminase-like protein 3 isoform X1 [Zerene cesonia]|uniref:probable inactive tRNA-specific adenosine deaminase-like protein 3 isoform X1 n=1 Tax=Zerene cesonia TaxID=33412 RepID=UPI0018E4E5E3|nr:probable inactive tRNA-specific adenosine deaminase-like protein 3 isoform X1 [Zerene cesonia]